VQKWRLLKGTVVKTEWSLSLGFGRDIKYAGKGLKFEN
jgi:hypothetical protein